MQFVSTTPNWTHYIILCKINQSIPISLIQFHSTHSVECLYVLAELNSFALLYILWIELIRITHYTLYSNSTVCTYVFHCNYYTLNWTIFSNFTHSELNYLQQFHSLTTLSTAISLYCTLFVACIIFHCFSLHFTATNSTYSTIGQLTDTLLHSNSIELFTCTTYMHSL